MLDVAGDVNVALPISSHSVLILTVVLLCERVSMSFTHLVIDVDNDEIIYYGNLIVCERYAVAKRTKYPRGTFWVAEIKIVDKGY
jgi:hypothetical protein